MSDRTKSLTAVAVSAVAFVVIVVGLSASPASEPTVEERIAALSATIRCPFCNGESLADSSSAVAADYRALITERVEAGATDDEIRSEFAENFGDAFILDDSGSGWSLALWIVPVIVAAFGVGAIVWMRRAADAEVEDTEQMRVTT